MQCNTEWKEESFPVPSKRELRRQRRKLFHSQAQTRELFVQKSYLLELVIESFWCVLIISYLGRL